MITEPPREILWSSDGKCAVGVLLTGRCLHIAGGIIGPTDTKTAMVDDLTNLADLNNLTVAFYHDEDAELFRSRDFTVTKFGVELRVPLSQHTWSGKQFEWVRRQKSFVRRQSVVMSEVQHQAGKEWPECFSELKVISQQSQAEKTQQREIPLFEGQLTGVHLGGRRLFIARAEDGHSRIEGFVICPPMNGGHGWAIEMYRKRNDAVRSVDQREHCAPLATALTERAKSEPNHPRAPQSQRAPSALIFGQSNTV